MLLSRIKIQLLIESYNGYTENIDIFKTITKNAFKIESD
jgi:hypothetical protein